MSEQLYEQISAFVDGELPERETELLIKRMERDPHLRATFVRYSAVSATLQGGAPVVRDSFAGKVSAAIAVQASTATPGIPQSPPGGVRSASPWWARSLAGFAVAATVAAVAILGVRQFQGPPDTAATQLAATADPAAALSPVVIGDPPLSEPPSYTVPAPITASSIVPAARLTNYVVAHSQYSSTLQRRNMLTGIIAEDPTPLDASGKPVDAAGAAGQEPEAVPAARTP